MEAGGMGVRPSFCQSTCPVAASIRRPCSALVSIAACAGRMAEADKARMERKSRRIMYSIGLLIDHDLSVIAARSCYPCQSRVGVFDRVKRTGSHSIESVAIALKRGDFQISSQLVEQCLGIIEFGKSAPLN